VRARRPGTSTQAQCRRITLACVTLARPASVRGTESSAALPGAPRRARRGAACTRQALPCSPRLLCGAGAAACTAMPLAAHRAPGSGVRAREPVAWPATRSDGPRTALFPGWPPRVAQTRVAATENKGAALRSSNLKSAPGSAPARSPEQPPHAGRAPAPAGVGADERISVPGPAPACSPGPPPRAGHARAPAGVGEYARKSVPGPAPARSPRQLLRVRYARAPAGVGEHARKSVPGSAPARHPGQPPRATRGSPRAPGRAPAPAGVGEDARQEAAQRDRCAQAEEEQVERAGHGEAEPGHDLRRKACLWLMARGSPAQAGRALRGCQCAQRGSAGRACLRLVIGKARVLALGDRQTSLPGVCL